MRGECSNCPQKIQCELSKKISLPRGVCLTVGDVFLTKHDDARRVASYLYHADIVIDTAGNLLKDRFGLMRDDSNPFDKLSLVVVTEKVVQDYMTDKVNDLSKKRSKK